MGENKSRRSLDGAYRNAANSLNAIRLALATLVIVAHAWPIAGHGAGPTILGGTLGYYAVAGFFGISGYLIAVSRERYGFVPFLVRRVLRIYPGFWVVLSMTAFVFAPIAAAAGAGSWHVSDAIHYVRYTFTLQMHFYNVGDTLRGAAYPSAWDGALWTLKYEFLCYLLLATLFVVPKKRQAVLWVVCVAAAGHSVWRGDDLSGFVALFLAGSILAVNRRRIPLNGLLAACGGGLAVVGAFVGHLEAIGGFGLAYALLFLGATVPLRGVGRRNDLSYGLYIYGFPVAQLLMLMGIDRLPIGVIATIDVAATVPMAAASWFFVERPAQRLAPRIDVAWAHTYRWLDVRQELSRLRTQPGAEPVAERPSTQT